MVYDPERYREKREKVLGIKKRGLSFGTLASIVAAVIILGLSFVTVPKAVSYMLTRNLDDAIYKLDMDTTWDDTVVKQVLSLKGVTSVNKDKHDTRLVITFDRRAAVVSDFKSFFDQSNIKATLLNQVNHRHRQHTLKEEEELETP